MKKSNILLITSDYPNIEKSSNIYTDLAQALRDENHTITVLVTEESSKISKTDIKQEGGISVLRVKVGNLYNVGLIEKGITFLKSSFLTKKAISKFLNNEKFNIILFMSQPVTIAKTVKWAMKKYKCPSYLMMKDIFPQNGIDIGIMKRNSPITLYFKLQEKKLYKTATTIGCMSKMNKEYLLRHNKYLKEEKLELFPNTQKITENIDTLQEKKLRKKYSIPEDTTLAIYGGNLGKPQGVDFFIEVLEKYKNNSKINFLIIARGTEKDKLYNYIKNNNIKNVYTYDLMPREDYINITRECDVGLIFLDKRFTIPNYPSKSLAYFDASIPIMAALDINNDFKDLIEESNSGYWSEAGNIRDYCEKFDLLIENKELREKMGKNGRKYYEEHFSVKKSVEIIEQYLKRLIN